MSDINYSLEIREKNSLDKTISTTVTYINGSVSNATLLEYARLLSGFTKNTFEGATKISKEALTE